MTFTFSHDAHELYRAYRTIAYRRPGYRLLLAAFFVLPLVAIARDAAGGASLADAVRQNLVWLIVLPGWVLFGIPLLYRLGVRRALARYPTLQSEQTVEVDEEGVGTATVHGSGRVGWDAISRVVETEEFVFIYVGARRAIHVPRRAIPERDLPRLRALFRSKLGARARLLGPAPG